MKPISLSGISRAKTSEEIGEYCDTHSLDAHWDETREVEFEVRAKRPQSIWRTGFTKVKDPGYWVYENVFSEPECRYIIQCLSDSGIKRSRAGARNLMANPTISSLAKDKRLLRLAKSISGKEMVPYKATLFEKRATANWLVTFHQDTALPLETATNLEGWGPSSKKEGITFVHAPTWALKQILAIRIHLDASTATNGPLRVIPNSHHKRFKTDDEFVRDWEANEEVECLVGHGGVTAMSPLILHASSKASTNDPRRVVHIEYAQSLDLGEGIRLAIA